MAWVRTAAHSSASGLVIDGLPSRVFGKYELTALEHSTKFHGRAKKDEDAAPFLVIFAGLLLAYAQKFVKVKRVIWAIQSCWSRVNG